MVRDDRDDELEEERPQRDVELTLGPAMLFGIACGLVLLCGLCFGIGYTSGRRSGLHAAAGKEAASGQTLASQTASAHKPGASGTPPTVQAASSANAPGEASPAPSSNANPAAQGSSPQSVRPAMGAQTAQSGVASGSQVQTVLPPGSGVMVQIAAVSRMDDANVLMGALRKHGYAVVSRRGPDDNLIHVQVGPFAGRAEANAMSQRLLNDGYNAVVLP
jgi:cell division septation protein DedD